MEHNRFVFFGATKIGKQMKIYFTYYEQLIRMMSVHICLLYVQQFNYSIVQTQT